MIRVRPQHEADITFGELLCDVRNSAGEKAVVTEIGVGIKRDGGEKNNHRLPKFVAKLDIHIQSWVIKCLLSTLRP